MYTGTVKWFNPQKHYGFIQRDGSGGRDLDVHVHLSAVQNAGAGELRQGQRVTFDVVRYWKTGKPTAVNLKIDGAGQSAPFLPSHVQGGWYATRF